MATVSGTPEFSVYVSLRDGREVGIHKFIVNEAGPLFGNTVQWDVKRLAPGSIIGTQLGLAGQANTLTVTNAGGSARTTAQALFSSGVINSWSTSSPHEVYLCTFHEGAVNSSARTADA